MRLLDLLLDLQSPVSATMEEQESGLNADKILPLTVPGAPNRVNICGTLFPVLEMRDLVLALECLSRWLGHPMMWKP